MTTLFQIVGLIVCLAVAGLLAFGAIEWVVYAIGSFVVYIRVIAYAKRNPGPDKLTVKPSHVLRRLYLAITAPDMSHYTVNFPTHGFYVSVYPPFTMFFHKETKTVSRPAGLEASE